MNSSDSNPVGPATAFQERFGPLFQQSAVGILRLDPGGRVLEVNDKFCEILGYARNEVLHMSLADYTHPDDIHRELEKLGRLLVREIANFDLEKRCARKDGGTLWVRVTAWLPPRDDEADSWMSIVEVESSPNAVVMANADGRIVQLNRQAESLFGYTREELVGQMVEVLVPQRFRPHHPGYRKEFAAHPQQRAMGAGRDLFAVRKDGSEIPVEIGLTPVETPEGLSVMATITDITGRKQAEEELRRTAEELERSNQDLEQFARVASHDLQEPLRMITGHLAVLSRRLEGTLDEQARQSIDFAVDGAQRMQALIRELLTYSRVGRMEAEFRPTDMNSVLATVFNNLKASIDEAHATILSAPLPSVLVESTQMVQLLQNLIGNAVKYRSADRAPHIEMAAKRQDAFWLFWVRDNGIGIAPADQERVFMIFQRLHTREEYPGTGIGLAICKKIVERHGGKIWVESQKGEGAAFFFTLSAE